MAITYHPSAVRFAAVLTTSLSVGAVFFASMALLLLSMQRSGRRVRIFESQLFKAGYTVFAVGMTILLMLFVVG
ncbi:MAG: hypothetical protein ACLQBD_27105 [Syntrophobacteraceae bacterium]